MTNDSMKTLRDKKIDIAISTAEETARYAKPPDRESAPQAAAPGADSGAADSPNATPDEQGVDSLRKELDECKDKLMRAQAECANIAKRLHQQHADSLKLASMNLARDLLPVLDNLDRSLETLSERADGDSLAKGVKMIAEQFAKALRDHGVEPIEALNRPFDPTVHEAIMHDEQSNAAPGMITQELQKGYTMHGRVLRPARVAVAADRPTGDAQPENE